MSNLIDEVSSRDYIDYQNSEALMRLCVLYRFELPRSNAHEWHPCVPTLGVINGIPREMTCIATDGIRGIFIRPNDVAVFDGHVQHFRWITPVESMVSYRKPNGKTGMFKVVRDLGAPPALYGKPRFEKPGTAGTASRGQKRQSKLKLLLEDLLKELE